jgi:lysyl-tRNA synthetase class II
MRCTQRLRRSTVLVRAAGLRVEPQKTRAQLIDQLLSTFVEPKIVNPIFLVDYPVDLESVREA